MVGRHRNPEADCFAGWHWMYDREHIYHLGRGNRGEVKQTWKIDAGEECAGAGSVGESWRWSIHCFYAVGYLCMHEVYQPKPFYYCFSIRDTI